ncbi:type IV secretion system protein [Sphingomonas mali]|uniref:type IV secretion system protein n=1 Tax=Sphingomonas mali TaxID=40682 RepID=UPI0008308F13|nr:type IV secretion system protein [Sphingomonas mali]
MQVACPAINDSQFLSSVLGHIDCQAQTLGAAGYQAMSAGGSASSLILGGVLTVFIALFGYRLILGDTPDARTAILTVIKLGVVLLLATSWPAFRTLAYDVALKGPAELAGAVGGASGLPGAGGGLVARLQGVDDEIAELNVIGTGRPPNTDLVAGPTTQPQTPEQQAQERRRLQGLASHARWDPARDLSLLGSARTLFLAGTIAAFASVRLIAGLLLALGPLFAIFLLFEGTRGLFEGWVRGLAGAALGALGTAIVLGVELALLEPWMAAVMELRHQEIATPAVPVELLALSLIFAVTLLAVLVAVARVAQGFRIPSGWKQAGERVATGFADRVPVLAGARNEGIITDQRSRAIAIADAVTATQRRESHASQPPAASLGRPGVNPTNTREIAVAAAVPLGQSFRRRTRGRVSAGATRRDSNR